MTYDSADGYVLLMGAQAGSYGGQGPTDLWKFSAGTWSQLHSHPLPQNCEGSQLVYDDADGYVLYLAGPNTGYPGTHCANANETWTYKGGVWTQLHPTTSPGGRFGSAVTNDSADHYVVLFGGFNSTNGRLFSDTWTFKAGVWTNITPKHSPSPRYEAGITYDAADGYVFLFGGIDGSRGPPGLNDTWNFSAGNWTQLHPKVSPPGPEPDAFSYDAADRVVLYTTAQNWSGPYPEIAWTYHAGKWSAVTSSGPVERLSAETAFDYLGGYILFFGGTGVTNLDDSWKFLAGSWVNISNLPPAPRYGATMAYDPAGGYVVLFGGYATFGPQNDTWTFQSGVWNQLHPSPSPPARYLAALAYDPVGGYLVLFGGYGSTGLLKDTWRFSAGTWTHILPSQHPPARAESAMTYDAKDGYVLLFGGKTYLPSGTTVVLNDTWSFQRGVWTNLSPAHSPAARSLAAMAYDAPDGYVVLFGGLGSTSLGDSWSYAGGVWTNLTLGVSPSVRFGSALAYDGRLGELVLFGGGQASGAILNDTWTFRAGAWTNITPAITPPPRQEASLAYDGHDHYLLLFGGITPPSVTVAWKFA